MGSLKGRFGFGWLVGELNFLGTKKKLIVSPRCLRVSEGVERF